MLQDLDHFRRGSCESTVLNLSEARLLHQALRLLSSAMARCSSVTITLIVCIVFYYLLGIWYDRSQDPAALRIGALTPVKKYSQRIVAVGDLHGDVHHAIRVLKMSGLIDHRNKWIGKRSILGQCSPGTVASAWIVRSRSDVF